MPTWGPKAISNSGASTTESADTRDSDFKRIARVPHGTARTIVAIGLYAFTNVSKIELYRANTKVYGPITSQMAAAFDPEKIAMVGETFLPGEDINIELTSDGVGASTQTVYLVYQDTPL